MYFNISVYCNLQGHYEQTKWLRFQQIGTLFSNDTAVFSDHALSIGNKFQDFWQRHLFRI